MESNWIGLVLVVLGAYLAFKLLGVALRLLMWLVVLVGAYWFLAPMLGWPTVSDLVYVFGPDFGGRRIEEVLTPAGVADGIGGRVVEGMVERVQSVEVPQWPEPVEEPVEQTEPWGEGGEPGPVAGDEGR
ncbi:MAG: hypothetical protein GX805_07090 [Gammaproteobacteria bacterium]|nr:hypothetical protein [Gammaproteobacteria bacterium]